MSRGEEPGEVNVRPVFVCFEISPLFGSLFVLKVTPVSFLGEPSCCTTKKLLTLPGWKTTASTWRRRRRRSWRWWGRCCKGRNQLIVMVEKKVDLGLAL